MPKARRQGHPHVLIASDLSPATEAHAAFAAQFAEALGARSTLFHVVVPVAFAAEPLAPAVVVAPEPKDVDAARAVARNLARRLGTEHPVHVAVEVASDVRTAIVDASNRVDADLLVLPTHGRTGLQRALLGSVAEQVLRHSARPVLLLTDAMVKAQPAQRPRGPVVVATDLEPRTARAHDMAAKLARRLGLPLTFVSILPTQQPPPHGGGAPVACLPGDPRVRLQQRRRALQQQVHAIAVGQQVEVQAAIADDPAKAIVDTATQLGATLLVLATHARKGLARLLLGSTAETVVRHAAVPVLCLPLAEEAPG